MKVEKIQEYLIEHKLDGWLLADFHGRNNIMVSMCGLSGMLTRRSFYFIPAQGEPTALVNPIEKQKFQDLPGVIIPCFGYKMLEEKLKETLENCKKIAMEYSPNGRLPYIGLVDAGTIELVKSFGKEIVSSADLVASFQAVLSTEQIATHRIAARNLIEIKDLTFSFIAQSINENKKFTEYDVIEFTLKKFDEYDMVTECGPMCAIDGNAGNPHYEPDRESAAVIKKGQLVLVDMWAKMKSENAIYADITWMAFIGTESEVPQKYNELFGVIAEARDAAVDYLRNNIGKNPVYGYDVDDACRDVVVKAGYSEYFSHRTGHSIHTSEHGPGPNIDNLETEDRRQLQQGHLFSVEPGIYMNDCGFRTEIDMLITHEGAEITTLPLQNKIKALLD